MISLHVLKNSRWQKFTIEQNIIELFTFYGVFFGFPTQSTSERWRIREVLCDTVYTRPFYFPSVALREELAIFELTTI